MANQAIPDLTDAGTLDGTELVHVVKAGNSRSTTTGTILNSVFPVMTNHAGKILAVNSGEDGQEWIAQIKTLLDLSDTPNTYVGQNGRFLQVLADASGIDFADVPTIPSYASGDENKVLAVNATFDGVEWVDAPSSLPLFTIAEAEKILAVNATGDGVEWIDAPTGGVYIPGTATKWRFINIVTDYHTTLAMTEMHLAAADDSVITVLSATTTLNEDADHHYDDTTATGNYIYNHDGSDIIEYTYASNVRPAKVVVTAPTYITDGPRAPSGWLLQMSIDDGTSWTDVLEVTGESAFASSEERTYTIPDHEDIGLPDFTGNAGKILAVTTGEDGTEWIDAPTGGSGDSGSSGPSTGGDKLGFAAYTPVPDGLFSASVNGGTAKTNGYDSTNQQWILEKDGGTGFNLAWADLNEAGDWVRVLRLNYSIQFGTSTNFGIAVKNTTADRTVFFGLHGTGPGVAFQFRDTNEGFDTETTLSNDPTGFDTIGSIYFRARRVADDLYFALSHDGINWWEYATPQDVAAGYLSGDVDQIGIQGQTTGAPAEKQLLVGIVGYDTEQREWAVAGTSGNLVAVTSIGQRPMQKLSNTIFDETLYDPDTSTVARTDETDHMKFSYDLTNGFTEWHVGRDKEDATALQVGESITWQQDQDMPISNFRFAGMCFTEEDGTNRFWFGVNTSSGAYRINVREVTDGYVYVAHRYEQTTFYTGLKKWFRVEQTASGLVFMCSDDGVSWVVLYTASGFQPTAWGPFFYAESTAETDNIDLKIYSYEDPDYALPITTVPQPGTEDAGSVLYVDESGLYSLRSVTKDADATANRDVSDADLLGDKILFMDNASANTVTVPPGLTSPKPLTVIQRGAGQTSFIAGAGVTINSLDGNLSIAGQHGSATLIPNGSDVYTLIGALV